MYKMLESPVYVTSGTTILITGGTGSLGKKLTSKLLVNEDVHIVIYSRDEYKQYMMWDTLTPEQQKRVKFIIGDVRDYDRLNFAMQGCQFVIHAAALKHVPAAEENPTEFIRTNIIGAENVINAAIVNKVEKVVALSTDKAANPINLYGATKLCSDKLFISANGRGSGVQFAVVRYGNVIGSRGSVIPFFLKKWNENTGVFPITDPRMTRFWITIDQGANLVLNALARMIGGELYVPKIPSMKLVDLCNVIAPSFKTVVVGIRPGEKLHEIMITPDDGRLSYEFNDHYVIVPNANWWDQKKFGERFVDGNGFEYFFTKCSDDFYFGSDNNTRWLVKEDIIKMIGATGADGDENAKKWLSLHS